jgi:hypothetical protein
MLETLLLFILVITGTAHFLLTLTYKWGLDEKYEMYRKDWMPEQFCEFCFGFWVGVLGSVPAIICGINPILYFVAVMISASIVPALRVRLY